MPTATYTPLQTITLSSSASSVTFGSIPNTYKDLVLISAPIGTVATDDAIRLNNDSGSNYSYVLMRGNGSSPLSSSGTSTSMPTDSVAYVDTTAKANRVIQIMDYSATDKHKTMLVRANNAAYGTDAFAGRWGNTAAVTSVQVITLGSSFASGSTFSLYGIAG